jgi:hypothetical protein
MYVAYKIKNIILQIKKNKKNESTCNMQHKITIPDCVQIIAGGAT